MATYLVICVTRWIKVQLYSKKDDKPIRPPMWVSEKNPYFNWYRNHKGRDNVYRVLKEVER